jgi:hypothetical protein
VEACRACSAFTIAPLLNDVYVAVCNNDEAKLCWHQDKFVACARLRRPDRQAVAAVDFYVDTLADDALAWDGCQRFRAVVEHDPQLAAACDDLYYGRVTILRPRFVVVDAQGDEHRLQLPDGEKRRDVVAWAVWQFVDRWPQPLRCFGVGIQLQLHGHLPSAVLLDLVQLWLEAWSVDISDHVVVFVPALAPPLATAVRDALPNLCTVHDGGALTIVLDELRLPATTDRTALLEAMGSLPRLDDTDVVEVFFIQAVSDVGP